MPFRYDQSNGFMEKSFLLITVIISLFFAEAYTSHFLTMWYAVLGVIALYLVWNFDIFSFRAHDWRQAEATEWSSRTLGQVPSDYLDVTTGIYERVAPRHGVFWWIFRAIYLVVGLALWALVYERIIMGTSTLAMKFVLALTIIERIS